MEKLKYKTFTWPENPEAYQVKAVRTPQYTTTDDGSIEYEGLGPLARVVTGSGVFHGGDATQYFNALSVIMANGTVGELVHPVWGTMQAYLTGLQMEQQSRENCIFYSFTFREADESGMIPPLPDTIE